MDSIQNKRVFKNNKYIQVKWTGYKDKTWQPVSDLTNCSKVVVEYETQVKSKQRKRRPQKKTKTYINCSKINEDE